MNLVSATSSQLLAAVVNSAAMSEARSDEMHHYLRRSESEPSVDFSQTLKALASALFPIAASGD